MVPKKVSSMFLTKHRGIAVMTPMANYFAALINMAIADPVLNELSMWQNGGKKGEGCVKTILGLFAICNWHSAYEIPFWMAQTDIKKAFDRMSR